MIRIVCSRCAANLVVVELIFLQKLVYLPCSNWSLTRNHCGTRGVFDSSADSAAKGWSKLHLAPSLNLQHHILSVWIESAG